MFFYNLFNRFKKYGHTKCRWDFIVEQQKIERMIAEIFSSTTKASRRMAEASRHMGKAMDGGLTSSQKLAEINCSCLRTKPKAKKRKQKIVPLPPVVDMHGPEEIKVVLNFAGQDIPMEPLKEIQKRVRRPS